ncbi:hypothetical protein OCK72_00120 [Fusobacterium simiae]|uniref:DUF1795 domain-containing protein n=1 Tax=Fusobacterium simiae TaxID=855 RepID=A0ABT4DEM1_FUSSI|nr:hypothetical protein [Fusobacterium simiae]MCY7007049.1 hypothetical protein [Fusobacterium simiae]
MKLKRISFFTIILTLILSFTTYSMETFNIEDKWIINLPEEWRMEEKSPYQQYYSFYPNIPFYSLIKIYNYDIQENQNIDLLENLKKEYPNSKIREKNLDLNKIKIKNTKINAYEYSFNENGTKLYAMSCYIFTEENLLIVNFYSTSRKETEKMFENIYSIEKIN